MPLSVRSLPLIVIVVSGCCFHSLSANGQESSAKLPKVRWIENADGCTRTTTGDGKTNYTLSMHDLSVALAVDAQELQLTKRRLTHFLGVHVEARYAGAGNLLFDPGTATLEYRNHYHVVKSSLDPDLFVKRIQSGAEQVSEETGRQLEKHPERSEKELIARTYQKDAAELVEFVNTKAMRPATLNPETPRVGGWILFGTDNRWIGKWKKREDLILRLTLADRVLEFPFTLPPQGDVVLKQRQ